MIQTVSPALRQRNLIFHEDFRGSNSVLKNQGIVLGTPLTVPKRFTGNGSSYITYPTGVKSKIDGATYLTIVIKNVKTPNAVSNSCFFSTFGASVLGMAISLTDSGNFIFYQTVSKTAYISNIGVRTYVGDMVWVFDGTQSTSATKIKLYINGVQNSFVSNNIVASALAVGDGSFSIGGSSGTSLVATGGFFGEVMMFNVALTSGEILSLYRNDFSYSTSGK